MTDCFLLVLPQLGSIFTNLQCKTIWTNFHRGPCVLLVLVMMVLNIQSGRSPALTIHHEDVEDHWG